MKRITAPALITVALMVTACGSAETGAQQETTTEPPSTAPVMPTSTTATTVATTTTTQPPKTTTTTSASAGHGCEALHEPGEYEGLNVVGDLEQPYSVVVPEAYANVAPAPLYVNLASGSGSHDVFMSGWRPYLDDLPGLMVMVNTSRGATPEQIGALIDQLNTDYCIDAEQIHALGTSRSQGMVGTLACEQSDRIASIVTAIGSHRQSEECNPDRPVPLLSFTGDGDRPAMTAQVETWADLNGCNPEPLVEYLGSGIQRKAYQNCDADVLFYDIEGMGHAYPLHEAKGPAAGYVAEYEEVDYLEEVYEFSTQHPLP